MTGGIGSGKSEAAKIFKELSVPLIDLDDISRKITQKDNPGYIGIVKYFGNKYLDKKKNILRKTLKADFFNSKKIKIKIESILHPIILSVCKEKINRYKYKSEKYIVIVIPLLYETENYLELIDESLLIDCTKEIQFKRVSYRDKSDKKLIDSIINSQLSRNQKIKEADKIIENNNSKASLKEKIFQYHSELQLRINRD